MKLNDKEKHLYIYQLQMGEHVQTGVIGAASAAEYNAVYIPVTGACAIVALMLLYVPLVKVQKAFPVRKTL